LIRAIICPKGGNHASLNRFVVLVVFFLAAALRILNEYERGVIFRLGRVIDAKGRGLIILIPIVDKMVKVSMRLVAMDVDPQDVITRDNVSVKVNAVIYFRVIDPTKAIVEVEKYIYAIAQLAQAAKIIDQYPTALQLRYLQTMREISAENNTTTVFPLPLDLFRPFIKLAEKVKTGESAEA